jgi:hypothetical protein
MLEGYHRNHPMWDQIFIGPFPLGPLEFLHVENKSSFTIELALFLAMVSANVANTALLGSDGTAVAIGDNERGQCDIPLLDEGVSYTQISAGYDCHHFGATLYDRNLKKSECMPLPHAKVGCHIPHLQRVRLQQHCHRSGEARYDQCLQKPSLESRPILLEGSLMRW